MFILICNPFNCYLFVFFAHDNSTCKVCVCVLQECYVHNLLRITVYVPALRRDVLELIISRMLTLDVGLWAYVWSWWNIGSQVVFNWVLSCCCCVGERPPQWDRGDGEYERAEPRHRGRGRLPVRHGELLHHVYSLSLRMNILSLSFLYPFSFLHI